jgi:hypothetical protein
MLSKLMFPKSLTRTIRRSCRISAGSARLLALTILLANAVTPTWESLAESKKSPFSDGPKTIASHERVSVLIDREITEGKKYIVLKISVPTDSQIKSFLLADPPRVVVDFEGASIKKSEEFTAPENEVIKQVRLGAHPSKIRFVLDMRRSSPPEYEWKAGKRQAILRFFEGPADTSPPATAPSAAPTIAQAATAQAATQPSPSSVAPAAVPPTTPPTIAVSPTVKPTVMPSTAPTSPPTATPITQPTATSTVTPSITPQTTLSDVEPKLPTEAKSAAAPIAAAPAAAVPVDQDKQAASDLGDIEKTESGPKVPTTFSIKGYKFEYLTDKTPALKIILNKPRAQAQISKVDEETYKIEIKDCGIENEDLELPQFPPHDFVGFVMVVAETVGKNTEISISIEQDVVLGTSVHENEIWVKKP